MLNSIPYIPYPQPCWTTGSLLQLLPDEGPHATGGPSGPSGPTLIKAYSPTLDAEHNIEEDFYRALDAILQKTQATDRLILMGEFNARVGTEHLVWSILASYWPAWSGENEP